MKHFIGIDPGLSGAAVVQDGSGEIVAWCDCSLGAEKSGSLNRHDSLKMLQWLLPYAQSNTVAILERVHVDSRDVNHMVSAEVMVRTHEAWKSALDILQIQTIHLYPVQWRSPLGLSGNNGDTYVDAALRLYPEAQHWIYYKSRNGKWARNHNRAEALLMSHLARIQHEEKIAS